MTPSNSATVISVPVTPLPAAYYLLTYIQGGHFPEALDASGSIIRPAKQGGLVQLRYAEHSLTKAQADLATFQADPDVSGAILSAYDNQGNLVQV